MTDSTPIISSSNAIVKRVRAAQRAAAKDHMVLEGERLVDEALSHGLAPEVILLAQRFTSRLGEFEERVVGLGTLVRLVDDGLLESISGLTTSPGVLALVPVPEGQSSEDLAALLSDRGACNASTMIVVVCGVQNPGNLGALVRTAEAAGATDVVITGGGCRPWNTKAIRGSMGSLLRVNVVEIDDACAVWDAIAGTPFRQLLARTRGGTTLAAFDWSGCIALWVTAETGGMPDALAERISAAEGVTIPMAASVESLNVTAAAAVLLFAAGRGGQTS